MGDIKQCARSSQINITTCQKVEGFYCTDDGIPNQITIVEQRNVTCPQSLLVNLCPEGFFCPDTSTKEPCPRGYYCPVGSAEKILCPYSLVTCPQTEMANPYTFASFGMFTVCFAVVLWLIAYIAKKVLKNSELLVTDATTEESQFLAHEVESEQYKKTIGFIAGEMTSRETMKHARMAYLSFGKLLKKSDRPYDRARANWRRLVFSPAFKQHVQMLKEREQNLVNTVTGSFVYGTVKNPLTITFNELNLNLKHNGAPILQDIFGCFRPFNMTALMGSSGAGKTTLLSLLRGKAHFANTSGDLRVNGEPTSSLSVFSDVMAFVPQDDIMYDELTVSENLKYAALLFNKRGYRSLPECMPMVHYAMELLGLSFVKHSIVGSPEEKGISGGQKKRVSIGMELMKEPALFFLDEPTSGLDSASSISLVNSLRKISQHGVNIVATLHQPRIEIFDIINVLYLLAPGGRVAYYGPAFGLQEHLKRLGYMCPPASNVSDFVMDVIAGYVSAKWDKNMTAQQTVKHITDFTYSSMHPEFLKHDLNHPVSKVLVEEEQDGLTFWNRLKVFLIVRKITFTVAFRRQLKVYYRVIGTSVSGRFVLVVMGILISQLFGSVRVDGATFASQIMSAQLAFAVTVQPAALRLFQSDSLMRAREEEGGIALVPLFVGKLLGGALDYIMSPMAFVCGYYPFVKSQVTVFDYFFVYFLLIMAVSGLCNMCAVLFEKRAGTIANGLLIILWAAGGIEPRVDEIYSSLKGFGKFLVWISPFRRTFEIAAVMEGRAYSEAYDDIVAKFYDKFRFVEDRYNADVMYLILYWVVTNTIGVLALVWKRDNYRYWRNFKDDTWYPFVDRFLVTNTFERFEQQLLVVTGCWHSFDKAVSKFFLRLIRKPEGLEDDAHVCKIYLQDLLQRPNVTLQSECYKCGQPVKKHRRQRKRVAMFSAAARQRQHMKSSSQGSSLFTADITTKENRQFDNIVQELSDMEVGNGALSSTETGKPEIAMTRIANRDDDEEVNVDLSGKRKKTRKNPTMVAF